MVVPFKVVNAVSAFLGFVIFRYSRKSKEAHWPWIWLGLVVLNVLAVLFLPN